MARNPINYHQPPPPTTTTNHHQPPPATTNLQRQRAKIPKSLLCPVPAITNLKYQKLLSSISAIFYHPLIPRPPPPNSASFPSKSPPSSPNYTRRPRSSRSDMPPTRPLRPHKRSLRSYALNARRPPSRRTILVSDPILSSDEERAHATLHSISRRPHSTRPVITIPAQTTDSNSVVDLSSTSLECLPSSPRPSPRPTLLQSAVTRSTTQLNLVSPPSDVCFVQSSALPAGSKRPAPPSASPSVPSKRKRLSLVAKNSQTTNQTHITHQTTTAKQIYKVHPLNHQKTSSLQSSSHNISDDDIEEAVVSPNIKRRRTRSTSRLEENPPQDPNDSLNLQAILHNVSDEREIAKILEAWATQHGRKKILKLYGNNHDDENLLDAQSPQPLSPNTPKTRSTRSLQKASPVVTDSDHESDAERIKTTRSGRPASARSINVDDSGDDTKNSVKKISKLTPAIRTKEQRRNMKTISKQSKRDSKSVPLPKLVLLRDKLKSRKRLVRRGADSSPEPPSREQSEELSPSNSPQLRRSSRLLGVRHGSEKVDKSYRDIVGSLRNLSDADDESVGSEEEILELEEVEESVPSDEGENEVCEELEEDGDEGESDEYDEEEESDHIQERLRNRKSSRKQNERRKRTRPRDIFRSKGDELTAREQQKRLDFLVQQSADIANELHQAMAVQSAKRIDVSAADKKEDESAETVKLEEEVFAPPVGEGCALQAHQHKGVKWLLTLDAQGLNAILADEMGLGKTIQTVSFLASLVLSGFRGPHLVIAPKNVCSHWADEVRKFYGHQISVVTHLGCAEERLSNLWKTLEDDDFDILVTSYDIALRDLFGKRRSDGVYAQYSRVLRAFRKVEFEYLVVDEAHRLKNDSSKINIGIRGYERAQRRLLLTGTPLSNNLRELWSLMNVLNPRIFSSKETFEMWFAAPFSSKTAKRGTNATLTPAEKSVIVDRLHTIIRPFFRRRIRADVCPTYTSADEVVIRCPMSSLQRALMSHFKKRIDAKDAGITNALMAMRGVSNHPFIVSSALYDKYSGLAIPGLVASSGKFVFLHYALPRLLASGHRVLIFSQFRAVLDLLEDLMELIHIKYSRLDGLTDTRDRLSALDEFNREGSDIPVFLLTTRAGGVGLNLQTADTVILYDSDWNPSADLQAVSRIQRIGQKKTVHIIRLISENGIEDLVVGRARDKLKTQQLAVQAGRFNSSHGGAVDQRMRQKDLQELLEKLDASDYLEIGCDDEKQVENDSKDNPEQEDEIKRRNALNAQRYEKWDKALLRPGEESLATVSTEPIWVDSVDGTRPSDIPTWLSNDADVFASMKALCTVEPSAAQEAYEDAVRQKSMIGFHSKKGRAARARRKVLNFEGLDDSEGHSEGNDPDTLIDENELSEEHESDLEIMEAISEDEPKKRSKQRSCLVKSWVSTNIPTVEATKNATPMHTNPPCNHCANPVSIASPDIAVTGFPVAVLPGTSTSAVPSFTPGSHLKPPAAIARPGVAPGATGSSNLGSSLTPNSSSTISAPQQALCAGATANFVPVRGPVGFRLPLQPSHVTPRPPVTGAHPNPAGSVTKNVVSGRSNGGNNVKLMFMTLAAASAPTRATQGVPTCMRQGTIGRANGQTNTAARIPIVGGNIRKSPQAKSPLKLGTLNRSRNGNSITEAALAQKQGNLANLESTAGSMAQPNGVVSNNSPSTNSTVHIVPIGVRNAAPPSSSSRLGVPSNAASQTKTAFRRGCNAVSTASLHTPTSQGQVQSSSTIAVGSNTVPRPQGIGVKESSGSVSRRKVLMVPQKFGAKESSVFVPRRKVLRAPQKFPTRKQGQESSGQTPAVSATANSIIVHQTSTSQTSHASRSAAMHNGGQSPRIGNEKRKAAQSNPNLTVLKQAVKRNSSSILSTRSTTTVSAHSSAKQAEKGGTAAKAPIEVLTIDSSSDEDFEISFCAEPATCGIVESPPQRKTSASDVRNTSSSISARVLEKRKFASLVRILHHRTQIPDIQFLTDVLLASDGDLNKAVKLIYARVSS